MIFHIFGLILFPIEENFMDLTTVKIGEEDPTHVLLTECTTPFIKDMQRIGV